MNNIIISLFCILFWTAGSACGKEVVVELPPAGILVKVHGHGNVVIRNADDGLSIIIIPHDQTPNAGPSFSFTRQGVYEEPNLMWVVNRGGADYVTVRKSSEEQLPTSVLTYTYADKLLRQINAKRYEYLLRQEGTRTLDEVK